MKSRLLLTAAAVAFAASAAPALAQDRGWSGFYGGVQMGAQFNADDDDESLVFDRDFDGQFDDQVLTGTGANAFSPGSCPGAGRGPTPGEGCVEDDDGVEGGVRVGYDMQFGNFVAGVVGEYSVSDAKDSVTSFSTTPANYVFQRDLQNVAAARVRLGYAMGDTLPYITGGYARGRLENSFRTTNGANSFTARVDEDEADGYQAGAGIEFRLAENLSFFTEYMYTNLEAGDYIQRVGPGSAPPTNPFILPPNTAGTDMTRSNPDFENHAIRVGMNVRF